MMTGVDAFVEGYTIARVVPVDGKVNYPSNFYTPTPPANTNWPELVLGNPTGSVTGFVDYVVTFSPPIMNPILATYDQDSSQLLLLSAVDQNGQTVSPQPVRISGNDWFTVSGNLVNAKALSILACRLTMGQTAVAEEGQFWCPEYTAKFECEISLIESTVTHGG